MMKALTTPPTHNENAFTIPTWKRLQLIMKTLSHYIQKTIPQQLPTPTLWKRLQFNYTFIHYSIWKRFHSIHSIHSTTHSMKTLTTWTTNSLTIQLCKRLQYTTTQASTWYTMKTLSYTLTKKTTIHTHTY